MFDILRKTQGLNYGAPLLGLPKSVYHCLNEGFQSDRSSGKYYPKPGKIGNQTTILAIDVCNEKRIANFTCPGQKGRILALGHFCTDNLPRSPAKASVQYSIVRDPHHVTAKR